MDHPGLFFGYFRSFPTIQRDKNSGLARDLNLYRWKRGDQVDHLMLIEGSFINGPTSASFLFIFILFKHKSYLKTVGVSGS